MNKVQLVGRLTKDVEVRLTQNQTPFCNFTIAVERRFKDSNGQRQTDFINCIAWKQTAQFIQKYFRKGSRIGICGSIQTRSYEKDDGQKVFITEVLAEEAEFVESNGNTDTNANTQQAAQPVATAPQEEPSDAGLPFEI